MMENTLHDMNDMKISHTSAASNVLTKQQQEGIKKKKYYGATPTYTGYYRNEKSKKKTKRK